MEKVTKPTPMRVGTPTAKTSGTWKWIVVGLVASVIVGGIIYAIYYLSTKDNAKSPTTTITKSPFNGKFNNICKITVRRHAASDDNHVDFWELIIKDNNGVIRNPQSGQIYPSAWFGTFSSLFDGDRSTRWHTNSHPGGFVNETTTPMGFTQVILQMNCKGICERFQLDCQHPSEIN